jgi:hypothetical protein
VLNIAAHHSKNPEANNVKQVAMAMQLALKMA